MGCMLSSGKITQKLMMFDDDKEKKNTVMPLSAFSFFFFKHSGAV